MAGKQQFTDARQLVDDLMARALRAGASDLHVEPTAQGYTIKLRVDGLLESITTLTREAGQSVVTRLMVLAQLLTYRLDVPQEGRASVGVLGGSRMETGPGGRPLKRPTPGALDVRVAVMPTTHGQRAVVRLPVDQATPRTLPELGLPEPVLAGLERFANADAGMLLLTGPAGSGKTTTIYALLSDIARRHPGLSLIALEDPVERDLPEVTQIQVQPFGELTYERVLRSILRQDPQVLVLGEIRDAATASIAVQAALSGHRLISTLHAGTACGAITRLLEMGIEPYQLTSAVFGVVAQRLLRAPSGGGGGEGGYAGRVPIASFAGMGHALRQAVLGRADQSALEAAAREQPEYQTLREAATAAVARGLTDEAEMHRVLGL